MTTRYLQKKDDPFKYVWTEALAARPDMIELRADADDPLETDVIESIDELDEIKTVEGLRQYAAVHDVHLPAEARSKAAIRTAIREAAAAAELASADPLADPA